MEATQLCGSGLSWRIGYGHVRRLRVVASTMTVAVAIFTMFLGSHPVFAQDCNQNAIPDACDISCGTAGGPCDLPGCGQSPDCNGNSIPDECETANGALPPTGAIRSPINGNYYLLTSSITWDQAEAAAVAIGGHLATIRSDAENQWLIDTFNPLSASAACHIGFSDSLNEGQWVWLSGEPVTYTNWHANEPNNNQNQEDVAEFYVRSTGPTVPVGGWNDRPASNSKPGIVEIPGARDCNNNGQLDECDIATASASDCNHNSIPDSCDLQRVLADSFLDFSSSQGQGNWYYGYYVAPFTSETFTLMGQFLGSSADFSTAAWHAQQGSGGYWTGLSAADAMPNGGSGNSGRLTTEHWAVRRWVSNVRGSVRLTGLLVKNICCSAGCIGCDGSTGRIIVDGVEVWTFPLAQTDRAGVNYSVDVEVTIGSTVDFAYDPNAHDGQDRAIFTARIFGVTDCNANGVLDECDIATMAVEDCNGNGYPDQCDSDGLVDCDENGVSDVCDLSEGTHEDCNDDGVPDVCQLAGNDCNQNGVPDECDVAAVDCNDNVVPDDCDVDPLDPDGDAAVSNDCNDNNVPDECELMTLPDVPGLIRSPLNGRAYVLIPSSNWATARAAAIALGGDLVTIRNAAENQWLVDTFAPISPSTRIHIGLTDATIEGQWQWTSGEPTSYLNWGPGEPNNNGNEDFGEIFLTSQSGLLAGHWNDQTATPSRPGIVEFGVITDCNANGVLDECELAGGMSPDCNENNILDECEQNADCNGNGIQDLCDIYAGMPDCDNDLIPDVCQLSGNDCNTNGIPDNCEPGGESDCNDNAIVDLCDIYAGMDQDCNGNFVPDSCDIAGDSTDVNGNDIPDDCETDVRIAPVATYINPATTSGVRSELPASLSAVSEDSRYYLEIWVIDSGMQNTGLGGVYVDVNFCSSTLATAVFHGSQFGLLPVGTIQSGRVDEFGGATFSPGVAVEPSWVRLGWIEMFPSATTASCNITLAPSSNGVTAIGRGIINPAFIDFGAISLPVQARTVSYDLDGNTFIGFSDLALFMNSWLDVVPPGNAAHDFDCDGLIGPGDLAWFATGWQRNDGSVGVVYPPCDGGAMPIEDQDVAIRVVLLDEPSATTATTSLPVSIESVGIGDAYFAEIWASDVGDVYPGFTSAYLNVAYPIAVATVTDVQSSGAWFKLQSGADDGFGTVTNLGGSVLLGGIGAQPNWVLVGRVALMAAHSAPAARIDPRGESIGIATIGRGRIPWSSVDLQGATIRQGLAGDIDGDGSIGAMDIESFVAVLLGVDADAEHRAAADFTGDGAPDGLDVQGFLEALIGG